MIVFGETWYFLISTCLFFLGSLWRFYKYKKPTYNYSSLRVLGSLNNETNWRYNFLKLVRILSLILLCIALAQPRQPDMHSKLPVDGIDIMLALDASGSMSEIEDPTSAKSRFAIAKAAALNFIKKRIHDQIGLVFFGRVSIARAPLTFDKQLLTDILQETELGIVNPQGTVIGRALLSAISKLKNSTAKTKVIILLSDGVPTLQYDEDISIPLKLAKELSIRIYTIGIGQMITVQAGFFGQTMQMPIDWNFLEEISEKTDGQFFLAKKAKDLQVIYDKIDQLEKSKIDSPVYGRYFEYFFPISVIVFFSLLFLLIINSFVWLTL